MSEPRAPRMPMVTAIKRDIKAARKLRLSGRNGLLLIVGGFLVAWVLDQWGRLNLALPLLNSTLVLGLLLSIKWAMRVHAWFWVATALITTLLAALIFLIPWGDEWIPAATIAAIDSVGFCLMLAIYAVAETFCGMREG